MVSAEIIQGRKLFKGGNCLLLGGFDHGNYSREETIQERKLFTEIRYLSTLTTILPQNSEAQHSVFKLIHAPKQLFL